MNIILHTGDIGLVSTNFCWYKPLTYLSVAIRFFTKGTYNHCFIVISNWNILFVNEAIATGIRNIPLKDYLRINKKDTIVFKRPVNEINERETAVKANSKLGHTGYDFRSLLFYQLIYQLSGHWLGKTKSGNAEKRLYCSEYIGHIYDFIFPEWWKLTPKDLENSEFFIEIENGHNNPK